MKNCNCDLCKGKGWIETSVYDSGKIENGTIVIEKCDSCKLFITDLEAARFVFKNENIFSFVVNDFNVIANISFN
jgi:hypothetical protein